MGFYEELAEALDSVDIESRVNDGLLFVPIAPELDLQFQLIDYPGMPSSVTAANVFLASAEEEVDPALEPTFVSVVFSVAAAVDEVAKHVTTDHIITVINELLEGEDSRIEDLNFEQDPIDPMTVASEIGRQSTLTIRIRAIDSTPEAQVTFSSYGEDFEDLIDQARAELWGEESDLTEADKERVLNGVIEDAAALTGEMLELGTFEDAEELFDVIAVASAMAEQWEELLVPVEEYFED
ncbi:MAG TPA: hypothetical protein H9867_01510 [Candidatus Corynebacterium gallistercoris]|uniref:Uncharacterized protein n=1 Tax=Candidatus Corynebacterium gallistercoris TaxID=2838530 RepID=A0A9D1RYQ7_9CORY|nr:hypothetical protein [Candidatus Corynebacterium gallistercoris]